MDTTPTKEEQEIIDLTKAFYHAISSRQPNSLEETFSFFHDKINAIGTGIHEFMHNKQMVEDNERQGFEALTDPIKVEYHFLTASIFGDTAISQAMMDLQMIHEGKDVSTDNLRCTICWVKENNFWKITHWHSSFPWSAQTGGNWMPFEKLKARNAELERLVEEKTIELREAKEQAEAANEAKSIFLSTVSHELRTPLTAIKGFTQLNQKNLNDKVIPGIKEDNSKALKSANRIAQNLEVVQLESERLSTLINDLLDLAKIESGKVDWKIEKVKPSELIERAALATTALFQEKPQLELIKSVADKLPIIKVDRDRMIQVLINLLSNAVKFTDQGQVRMSVDFLPFPIISGPSKHKKHILFKVKDTGLGIPESHIDKIFERFQQVEDHQLGKPKGTGLGLPICKEIVEHHGGKIWVESDHEGKKGSTFAFTIPV